MTDQAELPGELLYEYAPKITGVVEYGTSVRGLTSGEEPPPAEGALRVLTAPALGAALKPAAAGGAQPPAAALVQASW